MKIALCQLNIKVGRREETKEQAFSYLKAAAVHKVDLLLFPEMTLTGFTADLDTMSESMEESLSWFREQAEETGLHIGFGWAKRIKEQKAENHYTIITPKGDILDDYIKIHPFSLGREGEFFVQGENLSVFSVMGRKLAVVICYDLRFPELFQALSKTADIIIVPANWPESRSDQWKILLQARAIENQCYILGINCTGLVGELNYSGDSLAVDPRGRIIESLSEREGLVLCDIPDDVDEFRAKFPIKQDRREDFYKKLY